MKRFNYKYKEVLKNEIKRIVLIHDPLHYHGVASDYVKEIQTKSNGKWRSNTDVITKYEYEACLNLELIGGIIDA